MQHPDEGTIHAWLDGALSEEEAEAIRQHVADCAACAERVAEARGVIAGSSRIVSSLDVVRGGVIPAAGPAAPVSVWRRLHLTPARAALAASVLIAASAMLAVHHDTADKMVPGSGRQADTVAAAVSAAAPTVAPAPAPASVASSAPASASPVSPAPLAAAPAPASAAGVAGQTATPTRRRALPAQVAASNAAPSSAPAAAIAGSRAIDSAASRSRPADEARVTAAAPASQPPNDVAEKAASAAADRAPKVAANRMTARPSSAPTLAQTAGGVFDEQVPPMCYQVERDSAAWLRAIPARFTLVRDTTSGRNIVRVMSSDMKVDSVLQGSEWLALPRAGVSIRFAPQGQLLPVSLMIPVRSTSAQASSGGQSRPVNVRRTACPP